jgi:hypothetical protein
MQAVPMTARLKPWMPLAASSKASWLTALRWSRICLWQSLHRFSGPIQAEFVVIATAGRQPRGDITVTVTTENQNTYTKTLNTYNSESANKSAKQAVQPVKNAINTTRYQYPHRIHGCTKPTAGISLHTL